MAQLEYIEAIEKLAEFSTIVGVIDPDFTRDILESDISTDVLDILLTDRTTGKDIAKYSVLHGSKQLFTAKYLTCLPSEEELRREIERQKEIFAAQHGGDL